MKSSNNVATAVLCAVLLAISAILVPSQAGAMDKASALSAYRAALQDADVPTGWSGSIDSCIVGTESQASLDATLRTVNTFRTMAGLGVVSLDPEMNSEALAAALMMSAAEDLSHSPGPDWPCYSEQGAEGAGTSNLFLGSTGSEAIIGYVDDEGIDSLGHRRWVLNPKAGRIGTGSTGNTNALKVIGGNDDSIGDETAGRTVAWPPEGSVPWPWVFDTWSASLGASESDLDGATVKVTAGNQDLNVRETNVLAGGYGTGTTISWQVDIPAGLRQTDQVFQIQIEGPGISSVSYPVQPFVVPGDSDGDGNEDVFASRLGLVPVKNSKKFKAYRVRYSPNLRGHSAGVIIRSTQMRCAASHYCVEGRTHVVKQTTIRLTGTRYLQIRKPTKRLTVLTISVSATGRKTPEGYVRGSSVRKSLPGPGLYR